MCYYNGIKVSRAEYIRLKEIERELTIRQEIRPVTKGFNYQPWPVIKPNPATCSWDPVYMEWGFLPERIKNREQANKFRYGYKNDNGKWIEPILTLNAMGEELLLPYKMYRQAALSRRCLVLSWGFYEWRHIYRNHKKTGLPLKTPDKYPQRITVKNKEYFFIAGIWTPWTDQETGETIETFSLCTTAANSLMELAHNSKKRQPTILTEDLAAEWISDGLTEDRITQIATYQLAPGEMDVYTIAKDFQEIEDPTLPYEYEGYPALTAA